MPRKPRLHVPGGFFHVILRGNARQTIFHSDADRHIWESLIGSGLKRYNHRIHAYCWMSNHVHILVQSGPEPLAKFMAYIAGNYARRANIRAKRSGHLFERRYRAILVQANSYLLELVRYIHRNPLRANMVANCSDYQWSSHHAYIGARCPDWLSISFVLEMFGATLRRARKNYLTFLDEPEQSEVIDYLSNGSSHDDRAIGSDDWLKQIKGIVFAPAPKATLDDLIAKHCTLSNVSEVDLAGESRSRSLARIRAAIAMEATSAGVSTISEVAERFRRSQSAISQAIRTLRRHTGNL